MTEVDENMSIVCVPRARSLAFPPLRQSAFRYENQWFGRTGNAGSDVDGFISRHGNIPAQRASSRATDSSFNVFICKRRHPMTVAAIR